MSIITGDYNLTKTSSFNLVKLFFITAVVILSIFSYSSVSAAPGGNSNKDGSKIEKTNQGKSPHPSINTDITQPITTATPPGGTYTSAQSVTLSANEAAIIRYTTDNSIPSDSSQQYSSPIPISTTTTLRFFAKDAAGNVESPKAEIYTINIPTPTPTTTPATDPETTDITSAALEAISYPIIHMQDTTTTGGYSTYSGRPIHAEYVTSSSQLVGDQIDTITLRLSRSGSPTGFAEIGVFNGDLSVKKLFGTINVSTISTSYSDYTFALGPTDLYTIQSGDRIGIKYTGGDTNNIVKTMRDGDSADPFDGVNSYRIYYTTSWVSSYTAEDLTITLIQTHSSTGSTPTMIVITSNVNPSVTGQSVTFTSSVTASGGTPTGTVTFFDGATSIGTGTLSGNTATLSTTTLAVGTSSITAVYSGDSNFNSSTSLVLIQTVNTNSNPISTPADDLPAPLRTVNVNSITSLMSAIAVAKPGDHIALADGVYDTTSYLESKGAKTLLIRSKGTVTDPIVIKSATINGAEIKGPAGFEFNAASYVIVQGFKFTHSQDNSLYTNDIAIRCTDCSHVRFTRNHFELTTTTNIQSDWLGITSVGSTYNRVDHNTFANKVTLGVFVLVLGSNGEISRYNQIDHNYFHDQTYSGGNGGECMRIGNSEEGLKNAYAVVEYNLFEKCNGDVESVTVKSSSNTIHANTFRNNQGSLTLRHGNDNVVDGNFFLDGKNGIRLYGHNHKIINNYFDGTFGSGSLTTLMVGSGTVTNDLTVSNSQHSQPQNILVAFNTFVNNQNSMVVGEPFRSLPPTDVIITNNIIKSDSGTLVNFRAGQDIAWKDNILFGSASIGNMPSSGYTLINPSLILQSDDVYRISNSSPAIDKASPIYFPDVTKDMDGQSRLGTLDSGADEYSTNLIINHPQSLVDVGPNS